MSSVTAVELVRWVAKYGRLLIADRITGDEFATTLLAMLAAAPDASTDLAAEVVAALPLEVRPTMLAVVLAALEPGFRQPAWHYGGPRHTEVERATESALLTGRVRAWAAVLAGLLAD